MQRYTCNLPCNTKSRTSQQPMRRASRARPPADAAGHVCVSVAYHLACCLLRATCRRHPAGSLRVYTPQHVWGAQCTTLQGEQALVRSKSSSVVWRFNSAAVDEGKPVRTHIHSHPTYTHAHPQPSRPAWCREPRSSPLRALTHLHKRRAARDAVPRAIPCRAGCRAVWDTLPRAGYRAVWDPVPRGILCRAPVQRSAGTPRAQ